MSLQPSSAKPTASELYATDASGEDRPRAGRSGPVARFAGWRPTAERRPAGKERWPSPASSAAVAGACLTAGRGRRAVAARLLWPVPRRSRRRKPWPRARQRPGEIPALWQRIATSAALAAPLGWVAGRFAGAGPVTVGTAVGTLSGLLGLRPQKVALGPLVGFAVGRAGAAPRPSGADRGGGQCDRAGLPAAVGRGVPRRPGQPARRAGPRPRSCRSSCRSRPGPATSARTTSGRWPRRPAAPTSPVPPTSASCRRSTSWPDRSFDPGAVRSPGPRVLRAHDPLHARHRPGVAAVGPSRVPALPHPGRPPARPGQRADEPARGDPWRAQPHRHDQLATATASSPSEGGSAPSPTTTSRSTSASTRPTAMTDRATSASASRSRTAASPPRWRPSRGRAAAWCSPAAAVGPVPTSTSRGTT